MAVGVVADVAALSSHTGGLSGMFGLAEAELEEGGRGVGGSEDIENGRCVLARSVVESQVDDAATFRRRHVRLEFFLAGPRRGFRTTRLRPAFAGYRHL